MYCQNIRVVLLILWKQFIFESRKINPTRKLRLLQYVGSCHLNFKNKSSPFSVYSYMYSGILRLQDDDMNEVTAASDFFQMTELKESLDEKLKNQVDTSNVFHWSKVADMYNLTQLRGQCDRIQLVKFKQAHRTQRVL